MAADVGQLRVLRVSVGAAVDYVGVMLTSFRKIQAGMERETALSGLLHRVVRLQGTGCRLGGP